MFLLGGSVGLFLVLVIVLSLRAAAVLPKPYVLFEEEVLRLVALHSLETFAPYLDAKHEGMVSVGDDRMLMRLGLRKHGTLVFRARVVPLYTRTFEEKRAGSSICAVHVVVSLKGSASSSEVVLYEQEHDWPREAWPSSLERSN